MKDKLLSWGADPSVRLGITVFLVTRIFLGVWMFGVRKIYPQPLPPHPVQRPYLGVQPEQNPWLEPWQRWDTLHYQAIASRGYSAFDSALFVPPLYPLLMRATSIFFGGNTLFAGIVISNLAFLGLLIVIYRTALFETESRLAARRSVLYLASFPAAFFLLAAYTESLALLAVVASLYAARKEHWLQAGVWGAVAALSRLTGALVLIPLFYTGWQASKRNSGWKPWIGVGLTLSGASVFLLYIWLYLKLPPWTPWVVQTRRFQGGLGWPGTNLLQAVRLILSGQFLVSDVLDLTLIVLFLVSAWFVWKQLPRIYSVYTLAVLAVYLLRVSDIQPLLGTARYVLALFPVFIVWGRWGYRPWVNRAILYFSWLGLLFMSGQFAIWGWVG